jgi:DNA-binding transcriptional regulator YdaS (Cro superfamily)
MELTKYMAELPRGGRKQLALQLGISPSYLSRLTSGDRSITAERCLQIEEATDGAVTRFDLRPDLPWSQPKKAKCFSGTKLGATLNQMMRPKPSALQSVNPPVRASSARLGKVDPPEAPAS